MCQSVRAVPSPDWRDRVVVFLAFLTSPACLTACKRHTRPEALAAALTRVWFDDIYVPGEEYLDSLKGAPDQASVAAFNACFTQAERESLARFHGFFSLRLDFVTNSGLGRGFFPENDSWQSILKHASYVLAELDPDPDHIRSVLASLARQPPRQLLHSLKNDAARHLLA